MNQTLLYLLCLLLIVPVYGQEVCTTEPRGISHDQAFIFPRILQSTGKTNALSLPFFDDFSFGNHLVSVYWDRTVSKDSTPVLVPAGLQAPGRGCVVFDGLDSLNNAYVASASASGFGDRLVSQPIDLSMFSPTDSVGISFFYQSGGRSDMPESGDSLYLFADTSGSGNFMPLWAVAGGTLDNAFHQVVLMCTEPALFHSGFRLMFVSSGNLNGKNDVWYLDMLYINTGRNRFDTVWTDESIVELAQSPLAPYSAVPKRLWPAMASFVPLDTRIHSLDIAPMTKTLSQTLTDVFGLNSLFGTTFYSDPGTTVPFAQTFVPSLQFFSPQTLSTPSVLQVTTAFTGGGADNISQNDTLYTRIPADSILGFDDGTAESVYGLNSPRFFGYEVHLPNPDTLTGMWIHFVPAVYIPPIGTTLSMEGLPFKVVILDYPHPDSILFSQNGGMTIQYSDTLDSFIRYPFSAKVAVPDTFWIGIEQVDGRPVAVGFDGHYNNSSRIWYENSVGMLQNTAFNGSLMIRPEFYSQPPAVGLDELKHTDFLHIFPNPTSGTFAIQGLVGEGILKVFDIAGKCLAEFEFGPETHTFNPVLAPGLYIVTLTDPQGLNRSGPLLVTP